jgi:hypothetical protein
MAQINNPHIPQFVQNLGPEAFRDFSPEKFFGEQIILGMSAESHAAILALIETTPTYAPPVIIEAADKQFLPNMGKIGDQ